MPTKPPASVARSDAHRSQPSLPRGWRPTRARVRCVRSPHHRPRVIRSSQTRRSPSPRARDVLTDNLRAAQARPSPIRTLRADRSRRARGQRRGQQIRSRAPPEARRRARKAAGRRPGSLEACAHRDPAAPRAPPRARLRGGRACGTPPPPHAPRVASRTRTRTRICSPRPGLGTCEGPATAVAVSTAPLAAHPPHARSGAQTGARGRSRARTRASLTIRERDGTREGRASLWPMTCVPCDSKVASAA